MDALQAALSNINSRLADNRYPGRGFVLGRSEDGEHLVQVYWIMGRSENSRNRVFSNDGGRVFTEAADPSKVKDPSLIIYNAMDEVGDKFVVSNGVQTDSVISTLATDLDFPQDMFLQGLETYEYEPDKPNFTPRITGMWNVTEMEAHIVIIRKSVWDDWCDRIHYHYEYVEKGLGYCITTYLGDGNPLPSFQGEPFLVPVLGGINDVSRDYWEKLDEENVVSLAVKFIPVKTLESTILITNKYTKT